MILKKSLINLEIKGKPNPENNELFDSNQRYSFADGDTGNSLRDESEYNYQIDSNIDYDGDYMLDEQEGIIYACNESTDNLIKYSRVSSNIIVSNNSKINSNWDSIDEDLRYSSIINGSSNIILEKFYSSDEDYKLFLKNAEENSFPMTKITILDKRKIINSLANYCNFKRMENSIEELDEDTLKITIFKNNLDKIAYVTTSNGHSFICDIAESHQDKVIGLQDRDRLDYNHGMLFVYKRASDLYFHMGNVKFAIDIIFIGDNNRVLKICDNIQPKTLGSFGCANAKTVLEINGGFCKKNSISVGDYIEYEKMSSADNKKLSKASGLKSFSKYAKLSRFDNVSSRTILAVNEEQLFPKNSTYFDIDGAKISWSSLKLFDSLDIKSRQVKIASFSDKINKSAFEFPFAERIVIYGSIDNSKVNKIAISKLFESISLKNIEFDILNTGDMDYRGVEKALKNKYCSEKIFFSSGPLYKSAAFPVSESVKELAKKADERLLICLKSLSEIINDLDQNVNAYSAYKDDQAVISASKAQYHQSVKKIIEKYESLLDTVKVSMKILYEIKDASQVEDSIKGMAQSASLLSESLNKIFELVNKIDDLEFFNQLSSLTEDFKNLSKDAEFSMKGTREFIHSHILGVLILS